MILAGERRRRDLGMIRHQMAADAAGPCAAARHPRAGSSSADEPRMADDLPRDAVQPGANRPREAP